VVVQRVYRRYRLLRKWHLVSVKVLEIVRTMLREREAQEEEAELLENFREILASGFSAQKVSINGALKNIQLQLVVRPEDEECYLTWAPSRKRQPRIHLRTLLLLPPLSPTGALTSCPSCAQTTFKKSCPCSKKATSTRPGSPPK
jgi:hypothetical protein